MTRPDNIRMADAATILGALDLGTRRQVQARVNTSVARFLGRTIVGDPPVQHAAPVLAAARAVAGLALIFGDPALIDLVADEARLALRDGSLTILDLFKGANT